MTYDAAALTSDQSSVTGRLTVAWLAGLTSDGADGVGGGAGAVTVSVAVRVTPPKLAVIVTGVELVTLEVAMLNVAVAVPSGTITVAGTLAALPPLETVTAAPPLGAAPLRVTVPWDGLPPVTLDGLSASADNATAPGGPGAPGSTQRIG